MVSIRDVKISAFDRAIRLIEERYHANPTGMGWRFAYGPKGALTSGFPVWLIGLNPGGRGPDKAEPSREDGNGYRLEGWSDSKGPNSLQRNVFQLFQSLGGHLNEPWEQLLDRCFTANACPFRSPSAQELNRLISGWLSFCNRIWAPILADHCPRAMVCLGDDSRKVMAGLCAAAGFKSVSSTKHPTGWGTISWSSERYQRDTQRITIVRVPHLSRFQIFTSEKCRPLSNAIPSLIASIIIEHNTKNT
jgi:hypothetical protein